MARGATRHSQEAGGRISTRPYKMSLLSLPERIFRRLVELPLELFSVVLGSQKLLMPQKTRSIFGDPFRHYRLPVQDRYTTEANTRAIRRHRKRVQYRARHAGQYSLPRTENLSLFGGDLGVIAVPFARAGF